MSEHGESININLKKTVELTNEQVEIINELKNQHWRHSSQDHFDWFYKNIKSDDYHFMLTIDGCLRAYLDLVEIYPKINNQVYKMYGVGNVCVDNQFQNRRVGSILMAAVNYYLKSNNLCGLLLCKDSLIRFYSTSGWKVLEAGAVYMSEEEYRGAIMFFDPICSLKGCGYDVMIDRNF